MNRSDSCAHVAGATSALSSLGVGVVQHEQGRTDELNACAFPRLRQSGNVVALANRAQVTAPGRTVGSVQMTFIQCGGVVHHVRRRPGRAAKGAASLVFVNALGTDLRVWDDVVAGLPDTLDIVRFDQRGHGLTEVGVGPYCIEGLATDLAQVLARLEVGPAVVCGLSVGGLVAQALALEHPQAVRALCLCGTATKIGTPALWQQRIAEVSRSGLEPIADGIMRRWFSDGFRQRQPETVRGYRCLLTRSAQDGYLATLSALASADLGNRVSAIAQPTLVVSGALDLSTPPEQGRALAAAIEGSEFEVLPDTAHLMCIEQPGLLRQRLLAFVEAVV